MWPFDGFRKGGIGAEARSGGSIEDPRVPISDTNQMLALLGILDRAGALPPVTIETALEVPAVLSAVGFQSRTLATLPLHVFSGTEKVEAGVAALLNEAPNPEWSSWGWRAYMWQQVFTGGRGLSWIERVGDQPVAIWPMDPALTVVRRIAGRKTYIFDGRTYAARDVIDVPFMLKADQIGSYSPINKARKAIALAIAMGDFAGTFFAGGGVPPLALEGPLPTGADAARRANVDITRAIAQAKESLSSFVSIPAGYSLKPLGFDPAKGQMVEARLFQIQEMSRVYGLPPVFVQDLSTGTMANTEQQDLHLVKHLIGQWAKAFEDELTLKLFGGENRGLKIKHNLDSLQRGDFKSRIEGLARAIQTAQLTPDEARALEERPAKPQGDKLYIQGATVPLGTVLAKPVDAGNDQEPDPNDAANPQEDNADGSQTST